MLFFFLIVAALIAVICGITFWLTGYLWKGGTRRKVRFALLLLDGCMAASVLLGPRYLRDFPWGAEIIAFFSMVIMAQFFFGVLVIAALGLRWIRRRLTEDVPVDYERRRMLGMAFAYPLVSAAAGVYGGAVERHRTVVNRYDIPIEHLPEAMGGFTIAQLSDVHLGMYFSLERLERLLVQAAELKPDLLAITGDIFDDRNMTPKAAALVDSFTAAFPRGIWYCHGNHEHMRGITLVEESLKGTGIHVLVNRWETVLTGERPLILAGADYPMGARGDAFQGRKQDFAEKALAGVPENSVRVLLAHHPEFIDDGASRGVHLTLTGHTHGSQVGIFGIPLFPVFKYTRGMVRTGDSYGYVHVGNGSWFPYRFGCPPEIACFRLIGKES